MEHRLLLLLVMLWSAVPRTAMAQTYFNQRHALEPLGYVGGLAVMPTDSGYTTVGWGSAGPPYNGQVMVDFFDTLGQLRQHRLFAHPIYSNLYPCQSGPLTPLPDGGFAMAGSVAITSQNALAQLWRFTATGDTLWTRTFGPSGADPVFNQHCYVPADSGFAMVGNQKQSPTQSDLLLLRTDSHGRERWRQTYRVPGQGYHQGLQVRLTLDGGFLLTGYSAINSGSSGPFNTGLFVVKTDAVGAEQWRYTLDTPYADAAFGCTVLLDGTYLISGNLGTRWTLNDDPVGLPLLLRLAANGQEFWRRTYGPARYNTSSNTVVALPDGSAIVVGQTSGPNPPGELTGPAIGFAVKVCAATGDSIWYRTYRYFSNPYSHNYLRDFVPTSDGGFVSVGFLQPLPPDTGPQSLWLFKTDQHGYVTAGGIPPTAVVCPPLGVADEATGRAGFDVYPNPSADGRFVVRVDGSHDPHASSSTGVGLVVLDAVGRVVWRGTATHTETTVDLSRHAPGVYSLRLTWPDGRAVSKKLMLITP